MKYIYTTASYSLQSNVNFNKNFSMHTLTFALAHRAVVLFIFSFLHLLIVIIHKCTNINACSFITTGHIHVLHVYAYSQPEEGLFHTPSSAHIWLHIYISL